jgi:predicted RNA binding protein YcfA (HicA-like mRNA interferase family)
MNTVRLLQVLINDGWNLVRVNGMHHCFKHTFKSGLVMVPVPSRDLPTETVWHILKAADLLIPGDS